MDYRFFRQKLQPPVIELDEGWEVLTDPRWPGGLYRQRSDPDDLSTSTRPAAHKRLALAAFSHPATLVKGLAVDLMV
ncbi:hypothetical protein MCERE1_01285 [Burkholderiaceae bacterium]